MNIDGSKKTNINDCESILPMLYSRNGIDLSSTYKLLESIEEYREAIGIFIESDLFNHDYDNLRESFTNSYKGKYDSDEDFAKALATEIGCFDKNMEWSFDCIDWEVAACNIMVDYVGIYDHYFKLNFSESSIS